jgi:hypothetical protein
VDFVVIAIAWYLNYSAFFPLSYAICSGIEGLLGLSGKSSVSLVVAYL